jgi:hypothetical protein
MMRLAYRSDPKVRKSRRYTRARVTGTMSRRRCMARSWFSKVPP